MVVNRNPHCSCGICKKPVAVGARVVWAGPVTREAHYECRFPPAKQVEPPRQGVLF